MKLTWPVAGYPISRGSEAHEAENQEKAVDIACPQGTPLLAVHDGLIAYTGYRGDCGLAVDIIFQEDGADYVCRYCHLSWALITVGQLVEAGQLIGFAGSTGLSSGPHLHLACWRDGERVRPEDYLTEAPMRRTPEQESLIQRLRGYAAELDRSRAPRKVRREVIAAELRKDADDLEVEWPEVP